MAGATSSIAVLIHIAAFGALSPAYTGSAFLPHVTTRPAQTTTVFLPHLYRPEATDCMGRAIFLDVGMKGTALLSGPPVSPSVVSAEVAHIMASRQERVVYVVGERSVSYGDVAALITTLQKSVSSLHIVLVSQADLRGLGSGMCLGITVPRAAL